MNAVYAGVRGLAYSGDLDWQVPWPGTQFWTSNLGENLGLISAWQPWFIADPFNFGSQVRRTHHGSTALSLKQLGVCALPKACNAETTVLPAALVHPAVSAAVHSTQAPRCTTPKSSM